MGIGRLNASSFAYLDSLQTSESCTMVLGELKDKFDSKRQGNGCGRGSFFQQDTDAGLVIQVKDTAPANQCLIFQVWQNHLDLTCSAIRITALHPQSVASINSWQLGTTCKHRL